MTRQPQSVGISTTARCNAQCAHCCISCSPQSTDTITNTDIDNIINDLINHPDVYEVGFTGGEPLLHKTQLLKWISKIHSAKMKVTLTSNGFWGITHKKALDVFRELETSGLSHLTISYDDFHAPFIAVERIKNVLEASKHSRIPTILNMCVTKKKKSFKVLEELGDSALGIQITRFPLQPSGTGLSIDKTELITKPLEKISLRCPGFEILYHSDGKIYPCCSPAVFNTDLTIGQITEMNHERAVQAVERNALLAVIQKKGFQWFIDRIKEINPKSPIVNLKNAVSACDVCRHVVNDAESLNILRSEIMHVARNNEVKRG